MSRTRLLLPMLICFALVGIQATIYWNKLPDPVASHFGPSGRPNGTQTKEVYFGFELVLIFITTGMFSLIASRLPKVKPELYNIPNKDYWLSKERAPETIRFIQRRLWLMGVVAGLFTVLIAQLVLDTNLKGEPLSQTSIVGLVAAFAAVIVGFSVSMAIRFARKA